MILIVLKFKKVFVLNNVNNLPIIYNIARYEQKAVIVLLALLYLTVKNIHLGPTLPAFLNPYVAKILMKDFEILPYFTSVEKFDRSTYIKFSFFKYIFNMISKGRTCCFKQHWHLFVPYGSFLLCTHYRENSFYYKIKPSL